MQHTDCRTSFPALEIQQNAVLVRWEEQGEAMNTGEFVIDFPPDAKRGDKYWLEVVIYAPGQAGARLIQP
jgi:hypothetical protein